jgi:uncharacterized LabA/DUF88 family protein
MSKSVAVLLDGGFVLKRLYRLLGNEHPSAEAVYQFALKCVRPQPTEELFRMYYYDCPPYSSSVQNPLDRSEKVHLGESATARRMKAFQDELALMDSVAYRKGELLFKGWSVSPRAINDLVAEPRPLKSDDLTPELIQKRVDMKIGLDVAWMASKRIIDRIILVTADTDFIPAMKFARREGTQVSLVPMGVKLRTSLREHADEVRDVEFGVEDVGVDFV